LIDLAAFRLAHPEFGNQPDAQVQACLDEAELRTDATVFGSLTNEAHRWLAADLLVSRPTGREARQEKMLGGESIYRVRRLELETICGGFQGGAN